jgi:hypothetical protein
MLAAVLHRFPALSELRVQFAALACVTALPFVAGAAYDIWFAMQASSGLIASDARSDVIEVRIGGLAIALMVSGLLAALILHRMMPARREAAGSAAPRDLSALKFSAGARERGVRVEGAVRRGFAEFRVSDAGAGFDPASAGKLFHLFERLNGEDEHAGLGTGRALVKRIVERHGGFVWADGAPGKGATVGFALPLAARS